MTEAVRVRRGQCEAHFDDEAEECSAVGDYFALVDEDEMYICIAHHSRFLWEGFQVHSMSAAGFQAGIVPFWHRGPIGAWSPPNY